MTSVVLETDRVIIGILRSRDQPREGGIGDEFLRSHLTSVLKNDAGWGGGVISVGPPPGEVRSSLHTGGAACQPRAAGHKCKVWFNKSSF